MVILAKRLIMGGLLFKEKHMTIMTYYMGIDIGISGAIALLDPDGKFMAVEDIPVMLKAGGAGAVKNYINTAGLDKLLFDLFLKADDDRKKHNGWEADIFCIYEQLSARPALHINGKVVQGSASNFSLGDSFGCVRAVVACSEYRSKAIAPAVWKKHFKLGKDKELARALAIHMFPTAPLHRKKDHNRAEALLLARYAYEKKL